MYFVKVKVLKQSKWTLVNITWVNEGTATPPSTRQPQLKNSQPSPSASSCMSRWRIISIGRKYLYNQHPFQVYAWHDYRSDFMVASSILGGASLFAVLSAILATQKEDRIDHL